MDKLNLIYSIDRILSSARYPVSRKKLEDDLQCSRSTVNRLIQYMRDFFGAPIEYDRALNGYHYLRDQKNRYQLPGLWFNADELYALLTIHNLLHDIQPGLLENHIKPLRSRIENILTLQKYDTNDIQNRVRILQKAVRPTSNSLFQALSTALLERKRILIHYHARGNDQFSEREISPQRMVFYNNNWYLDAWCHTKKGLRTFSIDRITKSTALDKTSENINDATMDEHLSTSYGIFSGTPENTAQLIFSQQQARWVADEQWHPQQQGSFLDDGSYQLAVPYSNPQELIMDILKYGAEVEVIAPEELREQIKQRLKAALAKYD